ncbi:MAG: glycosyltransferase family 1 protein [Elusimicrobia bacterium]|nr:glycosyltransferase family 1 protein [Elusimicrobiota bacterium]MBK7575391.1 glycosyltransferase family 1 protein [Elusimicrobiota bacterium]MBK8125682.1 glycosyltransferase family 1 protein [Elusimicrobiota bacterium]MBK9922196.1 glycosyltransferase family 1 protein [Elusimicrobiota bacterium]
MQASLARALVFYARSVPGWRQLAVETVRHVTGLRLDHVPAGWRDARWVRRFFKDTYQSLSYVEDWREAFARHPRLRVSPCNINNPVEIVRALRALKEADLVVALHSAVGDHLGVMRRIGRFLQGRRGPAIALFGNEYNLMDEKIDFARRAGVDFIGSQLPPAAAAQLYAGLPRVRVLHAPAALNPDVYRPGPSGPRPVDLGFRGQAYPLFVGDVERTDAVNALSDAARRAGLAVDVRFAPLERGGWSDFLAGCAGIPGAESGTYFLEPDSKLLARAQAYCRRRPAATWPEVRERFFTGARKINGKAISSRHFEPLGTKTCQVLLEGEYNGILKPMEHYIPVRKDLSNVDEAVALLADPAVRARITETAHAFARAGHTYLKRVDDLVRAALPGAEAGGGFAGQ